MVNSSEQEPPTELLETEAWEERGMLALTSGEVTVSRHHSQSGWAGYMLKMPVHCIDEPWREFTWKTHIGVDEETAQKLAGLIHALSQSRPEAAQGEHSERPHTAGRD